MTYGFRHGRQMTRITLDVVVYIRVDNKYCLDSMKNNKVSYLSTRLLLNENVALSTVSTRFLFLYFHSSYTHRS